MTLHTLTITASKTNQQPDCGWAVFLNDQLFSGNISRASLRRAEMLALIRAAKQLTPGDTLHISVKHPYLAEGFSRLEYWGSHQWKRKNGRQVQNRDLWVRIAHLLSGIKVVFVDHDNAAREYAQLQLLARTLSGKSQIEIFGR